MYILVISSTLSGSVWKSQLRIFPPNLSLTLLVEEVGRSGPFNEHPDKNASCAICSRCAETRRTVSLLCHLPKRRVPVEEALDLNLQCTHTHTHPQSGPLAGAHHWEQDAGFPKNTWETGDNGGLCLGMFQPRCFRRGACLCGPRQSRQICVCECFSFSLSLNAQQF